MANNYGYLIIHKKNFYLLDASDFVEGGEERPEPEEYHDGIYGLPEIIPMKKPVVLLNEDEQGFVEITWHDSIEEAENNLKVKPKNYRYHNFTSLSPDDYSDPSFCIYANSYVIRKFLSTYKFTDNDLKQRNHEKRSCPMSDDDS